MFLQVVREGEAPVELLTANGSPGGSPSRTLTKTSKDFLKVAKTKNETHHGDKNSTEKRKGKRYKFYLFLRSLCDLCASAVKNLTVP